MNYIYDITLNFNKEYYEFFDWNITDEITEIRKIPICKISSDQFYEIKNYDVEFSIDLLNLIRNKTEYFKGRNIKLMSALLLTDGLDVMAINIDSTVLYSSLQIEEELDIINQLDKDIVPLDYKILKKKKILLKTRKQIIEESSIKEMIKSLLKENNASKLKYIYYECFDKKEDNINKIVDALNRNTDNKSVISKLNHFFNSKTV